MPRVRITGYLDLDNLNDGDLDETDSTGLSASGYEYVTAMSTEEHLAIGDLDDVTIEKVND